MNNKNFMLHRKNQKGFTLIELMITVAIIGILSQIALPAYGTYITQAKILVPMGELSIYRKAVSLYLNENRDFSKINGRWQSAAKIKSIFGVGAGRSFKGGSDMFMYYSGYKSSDHRFYTYIYFYHKRWGQRLHRDSPTILSFWVNSSTGTEKCRYYTHGKGWQNPAGAKFVPAACR